MNQKRRGFTLIELSITIGVFSVFLLFFAGVFQVIIRSIQLNKQLAAKMYAETQLENAYALIARELQWAGSLSGNLARASIQRPNGSTDALTQFSFGEFGEGAATATSDGKTMKLKYAQVEKGILRKFSSYDEYAALEWGNPEVGTIEEVFLDKYPSDPATKVYFSYIGGAQSLYTGKEVYWPKNSAATATLWAFTADSLAATSTATLTYWEPIEKFFETSENTEATGLYHTKSEELGDFLLTLAYQIPEYPPTFKGIDIGGTSEYFGEVISKTTFWVEGGSKLKMSKYIPTVNATMTQTLFEPIKAATFTIYQDYVRLDLIYLIHDPANRDQSIEYRKTRNFWTLGAGG